MQNTTCEVGTRYILNGIPDDQLKQIPIVPDGSRLQQGATYLDLLDASRPPFTATGDMMAGENNAYVAKDRVSYELWNRLVEAEADDEA